MALSREQRIALARELARLAPPPERKPAPVRADSVVRTPLEAQMAWRGQLKVGRWRLTSKGVVPAFGKSHTFTLGGSVALGKPVDGGRCLHGQVFGWPSQWSREAARPIHFK